MAMKKIIFKGLPNTTTPLSADNLNAIQNNAEAYIEPLKQNILSDNLFDGKLLTNKTRSTTSGSIGTMEGWSTTENILPVIGGESIVISIEGAIQSCRVLWYSANGEYISSISSGGQAVELPSTAKYFAFNISSASVTGNIMVNYGTEAMEYQPYVNALEEKISNKVPSFSGDLNTIKTTGFIYALGSATNTPQANISYYVTTISLGQNYVLQKASRVVSGNKQYYEFERQYYNGTWLDWVQTSGANISTTNVSKTGRIYKGKEEYVKLIAISELPNAGNTSMNTGLSNIELTDNGIKGRFKATSAQRSYPEGPFVSGVSLGLNIYLANGGSLMTINCQATNGNVYSGEVAIYYTQNS